MSARHIGKGVLLAAALSAAPQTALAQDKPASSANRSGPTWVEFQQLEQEVREQRQLLIQLMQTEQQRYDMLLRVIQSGAGAKAMPEAPAVPAPSSSSKDEPRPSAGAKPATIEAAQRFGVLEGKVTVPGGDTGDLYVYVDNFRGPMVKGKALEIKQENKQFVPRVAVVPLGSTVIFPNLDPIFHNVFSNSPRNSFDLGSYRAGDKSRSAIFNSPGVVDIFCNMHQRMSAHVLVVPSKLYTRVRPDGTFRLEGVPAGMRTVVAWSPSLKPAQQKVDVDGGESARVSFSMEYTDHNTHTNKLGLPYGSYKE